MAKDYKVFISHSWSHISDLKELQELLENRGYFNVQFEEVSPECPIKSENASYIKSRLKNKIINSDVVLGIAKIYASHSEWMEWELDTALKNDVPIIGVIPKDAERVSVTVKERAEEVVEWDVEEIVAAIRRHAF